MLNNEQPIDIHIDSIKSNIVNNFTRKWSNHIHSDKNCNKTITFDGLWKIWRNKCSSNNGILNSPEFNSISIGCPNTPERGSYFCKDHKNQQLEFLVNGHLLRLDPTLIKPKSMSKYI